METYIYFTDFAFPICEFKLKEDGLRRITTHFHGTGFFIGTEGYFLSAKHVINNQDLNNCSSTVSYGVVLERNDNDRRPRFARDIKYVEEHEKYDIVLGKVDYNPSPLFNSIGNAYGWTDVLCFGYPETKSRKNEDMYTLCPQFLKGYVIGRLQEEDLPKLSIPPAYELSFPIPKGVSGGPVFVEGQKTLLGIALISHDSVLSRYEDTEFISNSEKYTEKVVTVTQFGIAANLYKIRDWKPAILKGRSLIDLCING
ncbi:MAG: serine protease [Thermodesulfobacteriota bacterium]|nr:serine protease [Thermodesulfobacteriota bacterium]